MQKRSHRSSKIRTRPGNVSKLLLSSVCCHLVSACECVKAGALFSVLSPGVCVCECVKAAALFSVLSPGACVCMT